MPEVEYDLYADENAPKIALASRTYHVTLPNAYRTSVLVNVGEHGYIDGVEGMWFGNYLRSEMLSSSEKHKLCLDIYKYLVEWEYAVLLPIGPEDSEYFATKKLDPEWGHEV